MDDVTTLNRKLFDATKWSAITNIFRKLVTPITSLVLARLLTPEIFGVIATINIVITFADIFTDAGFQKYLVQHEFDTDLELYNSADVAFWTNLGLSSFVWIIIFLFRNFIADVVGGSGYGFHLAIAALSIPLLSFSSIQQAIYKREFNFKGMFIPGLINAIIPLIITVPLAYCLRNCWSLIIGTLLSNLSDAILLTINSKWKPSLFYKFEVLRKMFSFSFWTLIELLSIWLTTNIDIFILGKMISTYYLGLYKVSITTVNQIAAVITTTLLPVLFSALSRTQGDRDAFNNTFYLFQNKSSIILIPMSVGIWLYNDVVTWILLGKQWIEASYLIGMVGLVHGLTILYANYASEVYRAKGEPKISLLVQLIYIMLIVPSTILAAKQTFLILCNVRFLLTIAFILLHLIVLITRYKISLIVMIMNIKSSVISSVIMAVIGIFLKQFAFTITQKILTMVICLIVYFISCILFKDTRYIISDFFMKISSIKKA